MNLNKYLYCSTVVSIFTEAFVTRFIIDLKLFYLIILLNLLILILLNRLVFSKGLLLFYSALIISGILSIYFFKTNAVPLFISQWIGIFLVSTYFYNFYTFFKYDFYKIMRDYTWLSFVVAVVGLLVWVINLLKGSLVPLKSILLEPAHYSTIILPGFFYSLKQKDFPRYISIILLLSIFLAGSSLGLIGIGVALVLLPDKIRVYKLLFGTIVSGILLIATYFIYNPFQIRVNDTYNAIRNKDLSGVNLSSYAFVSNLYVAYRSILNHPLFGSGLGSHELSHKRYLNSLDGIDEFEESFNLNSKDANSLLIRIASDLGIIGLVAVFVFLKKNYPDKRENSRNAIIISRAILIYFFCKLLREGHYFSPEMYFFVMAYWYNYKLQTVVAVPGGFKNDS